MIAIHNTPGSFSDRWIDYCKTKNIPFKIVNAYSSTIISDLEKCNAFMWHWHHLNYKDQLFARQLFLSLEKKGLRVFPNSNTCWHFDDKVGQKYLLEAISAPIVPSMVFYDKASAMKWAQNTNYPKVFKLRGGAGASNVKLVENYAKCKHLINKAFENGFSQYNKLSGFAEKMRLFKKDRQLIHIFKGIGRLFVKPEFARMMQKEKGYAYFQEFIPNNNFDIRIIVIGQKAFAIKRFTRDNDFRASGSGKIDFEHTQIDLRCLKIAFEITNKLQSQCVSYDFIFNRENNPLIVEISYGFTVKVYDNCRGYWDNNLKWHEGKFVPQYWMIENILNDINHC